MPVPQNIARQQNTGGSTRPAEQESPFLSLAARAEDLDLLALRLDVGETFQNRFVLVWHDRPASFDPSGLRPDEYQAFWQDFARTVCAEGPRVDDTLHLFPSETTDQGTFWVVGGDTRLASHCANGLLYAGHRWQEVHGVTQVRLQCGRDLRQIEMTGNAVRVHLGRPQMLAQDRLTVPSLRKPPLCVDTGEPHAVSFVEDVVGAEDPFGEDFVSVGRAVCESWSEAGINWDLVSVTPEGLQIRTFERGVRRPTSSCGTGSAAAFFAACATGRWQSREGDVVSAGGRHRVSFLENELRLQGNPVHDQTWLLGDFLGQASRA
jgi:diaminopimelate epimerase